MNASDVRNLILYSREARRRFLDGLAKLPWDEVVKNREASHYSLRNILVHMIDVEDRWIHYRIPDRPASEWAAKPADQFGSIEDLRSRLKEVDAKTDAFLQGLTDATLDRRIEYSVGSQPPQVGRIGDLLVHSCMEEIYHMGEFIALFWQMNIDPPYYSWREYGQQLSK